MELTTPSRKTLHVTKPQQFKAGRIYRRRKGKRNKDLRIDTWNTRTLYKPGALNILPETLDKYRMGIRHCRRLDGLATELEKKENTIFYSCHERYHKNGVGFVIYNRLKHLAIRFEPIFPRICKLRLKSRFCNYSIINCHDPTEEKDGLGKEAFYEKLEKVYRPRNDAKIILWDINEKIGQEEVFKPIIGKYSVHKESNNGMRLINLVTAVNMTISSTYFQHKRIHRATWVSPDGATHNQIDHIIDMRHDTDVQNYRSYRGPNTDSDHYLVVATIRVRLSKIK